jgi:hypothetical protein
MSGFAQCCTFAGSGARASKAARAISAPGFRPLQVFLEHDLSENQYALFGIML